MSGIVMRRSARLVAAAVTTSSNTARLSVAPACDSDEPSDLSSEDCPLPAKRTRKATFSGKDSREAAKDTSATSPTLAKVSERIDPRGWKKGPPPEPKLEDFMSRIVGQWKVGPHVSAAGGVENTIINAASVGANAFALFLKSQRKWTSPDLKQNSVITFKERMKTFGYSPSHILPHGSYLINLGNPDQERQEKSFQCFLDDLKRCEQLGLHLYNFHPGSTVGVATKEESLALIAASINRAHKEIEHVVIVLENMAGSGNVIGSTFAELGEIIRQVEDKSRVGVCLDTCHMFAAGYDLRTKDGWQDTMAEFERDVGLEYLRGMHLNDSKATLGSKRDRHQNIGLGELGLTTFAHVLSDPRTRDLPLILETPAFDEPRSGPLGKDGEDVWKKEVEVLNRLGTQGPDQTPSLDEWTGEIKEVVRKASARKEAKGKRRKREDAGVRKGKRKRPGKHEEDEKEIGDECENHDGDI